MKEQSVRVIKRHLERFENDYKREDVDYLLLHSKGHKRKTKQANGDNSKRPFKHTFQLYWFRLVSNHLNLKRNNK